MPLPTPEVAPDLGTLLDYETHINASIDALLVAEGITPSKQRDSDELATPRTEVSFSFGGMRPNSVTTLKNGKEVEHNFDGTLTVKVITNRGKNNASHGANRGKARAAISDFDRTINNTETAAIHLDYYTIMSVLETSSSYETDEEGNLDTTEINFDMSVQIYPESFPL